MSVAPSSVLAVNRLHVVDKDGDALRARLAADRLLSAAQPAAPGLPAAAILIVRRVADPLPGTSLTSPAAIARWRAGVEDTLAALWRAAARPALGPVPDGVPAVLFDDHAELLACLAVDWATGVATARWWWLAMFGSSSARAALPFGSEQFVAMLRLRAVDLPAVFELLADRRLAVNVVRAISPGGALSLAIAVAREHGIRGAGELGPPALAPVPREAATAREALVTRDPALVRSSHASRRTAPAPWEGFVIETAEVGLDPAQRLLLGVTLAIRRDGVAVRAAGFWTAVARWWGSTVSPGGGHAPVAIKAAATGSYAGPRAFDSEADRSSGAARVHKDVACGETKADQPSSPVLAEHGDAPAHAPPTAARATTSRDLGVRTPLAGVFYLLNVGLFLGLYVDFTRPREPGLSLDPWDFAALLGRRLLPRPDDDDDRIWRLLAELASHDRAGTGFRAPRCWRAPAEWLEPFKDVRGAWRWTILGGRLRVVHPAGFVAIDVPASRDPLEQLDRELGHYRMPKPVERMRDPGRRDTTRGLARWVGLLADYTSARVRIALGTRSSRTAVKAVLERPGTVRVTPSRVDVEFSLADLPVAIRLAGLDRSPGWIPAAGRHLAFHFV